MIIETKSVIDTNSRNELVKTGSFISQHIHKILPKWASVSFSTSKATLLKEEDLEAFTGDF